MTAGEATSVDGWTPPPGARAIPIEVGAPPAGGARWFRAAELADLDTGLLDGLIGDLEAARGYRDGQSQGGGCSLFLSAATTGAVLRAFEGWPVPVLPSATTWLQISPYGNVSAVLVEAPAFLDPSVVTLRTVLHDLLDPIFSALHQRTRFPVVAQWAQLASNVASTLLHAPSIAQPAALAFMDELFADQGILSRARPRIDWIEYRGQPHAFATRRVCCYNYRGDGGSYCGSQCPLVPAAERAAEAALAIEE